MCSGFAGCLTGKEEPTKVSLVACLILGIGKLRPREISDLLMLTEVIEAD